MSEYECEKALHLADLDILQLYLTFHLKKYTVLADFTAAISYR